MSASIQLIVCYDIVKDSDRTRLHRGLKAFLRPVQKSVFEGQLPRPRLGALIALVQETIDHDRDTVRVYQLCPKCVGRVQLLGCAEPVEDPTNDWLVR